MTLCSLELTEDTISCQKWSYLSRVDFKAPLKTKSVSAKQLLFFANNEWVSSLFDILRKVNLAKNVGFRLLH